MRTDVDSVEEDLEPGPGLFYFIGLRADLLEYPLG